MTKCESPASAGKNQGKRDTRFKPGRSGNPAGKKPGTRNKVTMAVQDLLYGQAEALTQKCVELGLEGDMTALRKCLDRIIPVVKERPVSMDLPDTSTAEGIEKANDAILQAVATGQISPGEGAVFSNILKERRGSLETTEFDQRLSALEEKLK
jgi:hypothetical protein